VKLGNGTAWLQHSFISENGVFQKLAKIAVHGQARSALCRIFFPAQSQGKSIAIPMYSPTSR
jgi:hypothetical protein